jgi:hypothetical protein
MGGKETPLASLVDEIIQLWTSTWIADAENDNAIAENVQGLQKRCMGLVRWLIRELQPLKSPELNRARARKLGAGVPMDNGSSRWANSLPSPSLPPARALQ